MARSTSSPSTRRMLTMPWSGRRFAPLSVPLLLRSTIDLVRGRFISLGLQKLVHVRTLNKMTTTACHAFLTVDGIEPKDAEKLKTLNFGRYPDLSFPCPLCAEGCKPAGMPICCLHDLVLSVTLRMFFNLPWIAISLLLTFFIFLHLGRLSLHDAA